ncbi:hypothetical protein WKK05_40240 (plasmid) [Nostoc sp. UHCC 0302]|uniref:hypothetical protein n=1 Tax=Nostoc sp. UHCC 0302 TaxID=3134896 RepID=UPI00311CB727
MLATPKISAFTDSPRNIPAPAGKQRTAQESQLLTMGAGSLETTCVIKNCPGVEPEQF